MRLLRCLVLVASLTAAGVPCADAQSDVFVPSFAEGAGVGDMPALDPGTAIRFVTADDYPPFGFPSPDGTLTGFNVDLARALCDALKASCTIQARAWGDLLAAVVGREADAAIASIAITAEARRAVAFTQPYYRTPARFLSRTDASGVAVTPDTLAGRKVGVRASTAQDAYLRTFFPAAIATPFPTTAAARQALKAGDVEAVFDDGVGAAIWLGGDEPGGCCAFRGGPYTESHFFGQGAGIAVRKTDGTLRRALDAALARITASGRFGDLYLKYFPVGFY